MKYFGNSYSQFQAVSDTERSGGPCKNVAGNKAASTE